MVAFASDTALVARSQREPDYRAPFNVQGALKFSQGACHCPAETNLTTSIILRFLLEIRQEAFLQRTRPALTILF